MLGRMLIQALIAAAVIAGAAAMYASADNVGTVVTAQTHFDQGDRQ